MFRHCSRRHQEDREIYRVGHLVQAGVEGPAEQDARLSSHEVNGTGKPIEVLRDAVPELVRISGCSDEHNAFRLKERTQIHDTTLGAQAVLDARAPLASRP